MRESSLQDINALGEYTVAYKETLQEQSSADRKMPLMRPAAGAETCRREMLLFHLIVLS